MLKIIKNSKKYWNFIHSLRNDKQIKSGFISQEDIPIESHYEYMEKFGEDYYICLDEEDPVGFVGVVNGDIRFAVDKKMQNKGIGNFMISYIKKQYPNASAKVKIENIKSLKCFENNGYKIKYYILEND
jgi:GNAT superfamily N-acetyltransferase